MDIDDIMDCVDCESYRFIPGRTAGDPDSCYPDEATCKKDAYDNGPCKRMLGAIEDLINDGEFYTHSGQVRTREDLIEDQKDGWPEWFAELDFSSAPYWHDPDEYDPEGGHEFEPFDSIEEIYRKWFC